MSTGWQPVLRTMARIIDYDIVLQRMSERGFVSLYHNSGAFGFAANENVTTLGWIAQADPTIRPAARAFVHPVDPPGVDQLSRLLRRALDGMESEACLMPKSHWHYELHFGNRELLEKLLPTLGIDPAELRDCNNGSAIAFTRDETNALTNAVGDLIAGLVQSDFLLAFPDAATLCTIHHHKQLWWQTRNGQIAAMLKRLTDESQSTQSSS